nr:hypothetical protein D3W47_13885 [Deinococcus sp. RM]
MLLGEVRRDDARGLGHAGVAREVAGAKRDREVEVLRVEVATSGLDGRVNLSVEPLSLVVQEGGIDGGRCAVCGAKEEQSRK